MPHPIYIMAALTSVVALAVWGSLLWQIAPKDRRRGSLFAMLFIGLAMSPLAYYLVRRPLLLSWLEPIFADPAWNATGWSAVRDAVRLCYAPLTEEPVKLAPWLILLAAGAPLWPTRKMVAPLALAAGLGFAVGEIWLVAHFIAAAKDPKLAGLAWWEFGGFLSERLMTCLSHSLFALPTIAWSRRGWRWGAAGLLCGMSLHWLGNSPIVLMQREAFGWPRELWGNLISLWVLAFAVAGLIAILATAFGRRMIRRIFALRMICPGCGANYRQPIFLGLNCGLYRYERCSACRKWHWVTLADLAPETRKTN